MSEEDIALVQAREELKNQLAAGEYQTLVDAVLMGIGRLILKITRRSSPTPGWLSALFLIVIAYAFGLGMIYLAGDVPVLLRVIALNGPNNALLVFLGLSLLPAVGMLLINDYVRRILALWRTVMLDATESMATLADFRQWLGRACNRRLHLLVAIVGGIAISAYAIDGISTLLGQFAGYGFILAAIGASMFGAAFFYLLFGALDLSLRLRHYELQLFAADPSASEVISRLSSLLSLGVYLVAACAAVVTFSVATGGLLPIFGPILLVAIWPPIIAIFILNQSSLSSIIRRVKWKTLNGIQLQVEALQAAENYSSKETLDAVNRLLDYHDRVKATHGSALDLRVTLSFLNSLLLPLLAFLLANLDRLLALFKPH